MENKEYLLFLNDISKNKPNNISESENSKCPFCERNDLKNIIDEKGPFLLLENKYATLKDTYQLVLIETYKCEKDISKYKTQYVIDLIKFGVKNWIKLEDSGIYKSVIFYKNHGPKSGGTMKHPHMQIVGLKNINYKLKLKEEYFKGLKIYYSDGCEVNLSTKPISGFSEFNIIIEDNCERIEQLAINIKKITHYILNNYFVKCDSFNMFFYHWNKEIICKIAPRFTTSPLLLGYSLKQVSNYAEEIVKNIKEIYYIKSNSNF